jgi:hypothetical protein
MTATASEMEGTLDMPLVIYEPSKGERKTGRMFSPRKITSLEAWLKAARTVVREIPDTKNTDWYVAHEEATTTHVTFQLLNSIGDWATVTIDRRVHKFGS